MLYLLDFLIFVLNPSMPDLIFKADYFKVHWFLKSLWCFSSKTVGILLVAAIVKYFKAKRGFLALGLHSSLCEAVILSVFFQNEMFFIHTKIKSIFKRWQCKKVNYPSVPYSSPEFCFRAASYCGFHILHMEVFVQMANKNTFWKITLLDVCQFPSRCMDFSRDLLIWIVL